MTDEDTKDILKYCLVCFVISTVIILICMAFKLRQTQDRVERLEERLTERTLEEPTTQATTEIILPKEPSDDEIVISIGW